MKCYFLPFPSVFKCYFLLITTGWGPYAYFDALMEESNNNNRDAAQTFSSANPVTVQTMEVYGVNQTLGSNGGYLSPQPLDFDSTPRLDDIELGRR